MPSDYESIRNDEKRNQIIRDNALKLLGKMYSDRTHFLFELLQNAEDAGASKVLFKLFEEKLEVYHDGRIFDKKDVIGICGVGERNKSDDPMLIGKFGIGFKSVFEYTDTPEIYSGNESFSIKDRVDPFAIQQRSIGDSWTTLFVFPFNKNVVEPKTAYLEISSRLKKLSASTLLFLRNIYEIEYLIKDSVKGNYLREVTVNGNVREVTVIGRNNGKDESENWLIFERPVPLPGVVRDYQCQVHVEIGFCIQYNNMESRKEVVRIPYSPLVVFFPTEKETRLGFLIQGPYNTTPARDNIPEDDNWNKTLVLETGCLISETLQKLKDLGLLNVSLLKALPINSDDFPKDSMFFPIYATVLETLKNDDLLPTDEKTFVSAKNALLASADWLRKLLRYDQITLLYNEKYKWINEDITEGGQYKDIWNFLREDLKTEEVTPDSFSRKLDINFFSQQTDQWMIEFYTQLSDQKSLLKKGTNIYFNPDGPLRNKSFIRLQDDSHVRPFDDDNKPNAYLPSEKLIDSQFKIVKSEIASNAEARHFLKSDLGIPEFDTVAEVIENVLPKYTSQNTPNKTEHLHDIDIIMDAFNSDSQEDKNRLMDSLKNTPFILSRSLVFSHEIYRKPEVLYFQDDSLEIYFSGYTDVGFVSSIYEKSTLNMFANLGVSDELRIIKVKPNNQGHINLKAIYGLHERGLHGFDPNIDVPGLSNALKSPTQEKSQFIWNKIVIPNLECIYGTIEKSSRQTYENSNYVSLFSEFFGYLLIESKWLLGKDGEFHFPSELSLDELPELFDKNEKVADSLRMKKDIIAKLAKEVGIRIDMLERIKALEKHPDLIEELDRRESVVFPEKSVADNEHREERIGEQLLKSAKKVYQERQGRVRITRDSIDPNLWLREQYTNDNKQMVCQICKNEMPFKKRDGEYYFEAVEALLKEHFTIEHEAQFLALCPVCAAMYKEFIKKDENELNILYKAFLNMDSLEVPVQLGKLKTTIKFVETHRNDLKTIIRDFYTYLNIEKNDRTL